MSRAALQSEMLAAHADGDAKALVTLYARAADLAETETEEGFFLTHAYVFALEMGHPHAPALRERLQRMGREH